MINYQENIWTFCGAKLLQILSMQRFDWKNIWGTNYPILHLCLPLQDPSRWWGYLFEETKQIISKKPTKVSCQKYKLREVDHYLFWRFIIVKLFAFLDGMLTSLEVDFFLKKKINYWTNGPKWQKKKDDQIVILN